jgi:hypothetical protein
VLFSLRMCFGIMNSTNMLAAADWAAFLGIGERLQQVPAGEDGLKRTEECPTWLPERTWSEVLHAEAANTAFLVGPMPLPSMTQGKVPLCH